MTEIYEAWHYKISSDGKPDKADAGQNAKLLGEYTTRAKAQAAVERRRSDEGFRDWPGGFRIDAVPVDVDMPTVAAVDLTRVYSVWHFDIGPNEQAETDDPAQAPVELGVYSSDANATAAIARFRREARFRAFPDGFRIFSAPPDIDHWEGGFISWDEA